MHKTIVVYYVYDVYVLSLSTSFSRLPALTYVLNIIIVGWKDPSDAS